MVWPAIIAAGGAILGGALSSNASKKAGKAAESSAKDATGLQRYMYDTSRQDQMPWLQGGESALYAYMDMAGLDPGRADLDKQIADLEAQISSAPTTAPVRPTSRSPLQSLNISQNGTILSGNPNPTDIDQSQWRDYDSALAKYNTNNSDTQSKLAQLKRTRQAMGDPYQYQVSPDVQAAMDESSQGIMRSAAAGGGLRSGRTLSALERLRSGMILQDRGNQMNRLAALFGGGQTAASNLGSLGANYAANAGQTMQNAGEYRGLGYLGQANAIGNTIGGLGRLYGQYGQNRQPGGTGAQTYPATYNQGGFYEVPF